MTKEKRQRWITVQVAAVKNMLISVSKNNETNNTVVYRKSGSYIEDEGDGSRLTLRPHRGTFVLDMWVVPHEMLKTGWVTYADEHGLKKRVNVNQQSSFSGRRS